MKELRVCLSSMPAKCSTKQAQGSHCVNTNILKELSLYNILKASDCNFITFSFGGVPQEFLFVKSVPCLKKC